ncbi:tripartite tricarboxylate transporter permease [Chloroflexota bacterium]
MLEAFGQGAAGIFQPVVLLVILAGTFVSTILGIIPGLGGVLAIVLILPFVFRADPMVILPLISAIGATSYAGGAMCAILLGVPGTPANAATILDGFPMTRKGEASRAIGAAITASGLGGILPVFFAFLMMPLVIPFVLNFRSAEMAFLILLGLCFLAVLTRGSVIKGLISAGIGLLISCIGFQAKTGVPRFAFGNIYLYDGISITVIILAIFALPLLAELSAGGKSVAPPNKYAVGTYRQMLRGIVDVFRHWWLFLRCSILGYIVGIIPGVGAESAVWVAYGHAKQSSKSPEKFGTGVVEGIIAPESANNAKEAGGMLTTLAFGIPGSGMMVLYLAAFIMLGIDPGPKMLTDHTALCFAMLQTIALSNVFAAVICFFGAPFLIKITHVPVVYLFCFLIPIVFIGVWAYSKIVLDLFILVIIGVLSLFLRRYGYSLSALILGFILGGLFEYYLWHALDLSGVLFFLTPISIILIIAIVATLTQNLWGPVVKHWFKKIKRLS